MCVEFAIQVLKQKNAHVFFVGMVGSAIVTKCQRALNLPEFAPPAANRSFAGVSSKWCEFV